MRFHITPDEARTLEMSLEYVAEKLRLRIDGGVREDVDALAIKIAKEKVWALRNKLFPSDQ